MSRIDKTDSAIGVVRAVLSADISSTLFDTVVGVGLNASGQIVVGAAGQTGFVGVMVPTKWLSKAGQQADIFKLGDIVDITGLAAGTAYWIKDDGTLTATPADGIAYAGYTVEADRLILQLDRGSATLTGAAVAISAAATDPATTMALANEIRTILIDRGVAIA